MRNVPERPALLVVCVVFLSFLAGPVLGLQLGERLAPGSELAQVASVFAFPVAFVAGFLWWFGFGVLSVLFSAVARLVRGRLPDAASGNPSDLLVPPGYGSFVPCSVILAGVAGLLVGLRSATPLLSALAAYVGAGAAYGLALWTLARHGYLPFPEPT